MTSAAQLSAHKQSAPEPIQLGYAEKPDEWFFQDAFPSKIGGKPVWLVPTMPLKSEQATCGECSRPMALLLQLYTPEDNPKEAFHRTVYIFCCKDGACHRKAWTNCFKVFRSQLPEVNPFYFAEPIEAESDESSGDIDILEVRDEDIRWRLNPNGPASKQCAVCGFHGTKTCSRCKQVYYCCREHQIIDWRSGEHRTHCISEDANDTPTNGSVVKDNPYPQVFFPLLEIVSEPEEIIAPSASDDKSYEQYISTGTGSGPSFDEGITPDQASREDLVDSESAVDAAFLEFQKRVSLYPDQILRYVRTDYGRKDTKPLWVSDIDRPTAKNIPPCDHCGAERQFEFQILPQLLNYLGEDHMAQSSLDWGTLLVYSCPRNCIQSAEPSSSPSSVGEDPACRQKYVEEVIWRQDFSSDGVDKRYMRPKANS
ncbi:hypothetical protein H4R34_000906 [Dimargaris verticillata]|uniref:MYND-type domain-containing protein n=1 Tax=Dimargaris verticillata TaxID=2761393 RepID=A0A9W8B9H6_9FUNG|nr:hypothetical protein H4R34_000906 [Dimargaris verticillata]